MEILSNGNETIKKALCLTAIVAICTSGSAWAANPSTEYFHSTQGAKGGLNSPKKAPPTPTGVDDNPVAKQGALSIGADQSVALKWFENVDGLIGANIKSSVETSTLGQSFNGEQERVAAWSETAATVSHRYKLLAQALRKIEIPPGHPGLDNYLSINANWYSDAAEVYDDLLKPRRAARTQEELDEQLEAVRQKAKGLKRTRENLKQLDIMVRKTYRVPMARHDDPLRQFIEGRQQ